MKILALQDRVAVREMMYHTLEKVIDKINFDSIVTQRKEELAVLSAYIQEKKNNNENVQLNFVCTHNSRRSQFSQVWGAVAAAHFKVEANCFSSGVEVTAFNERAVKSLERFGFSISKEGGANPRYSLTFGAQYPSIEAFSKLIEDAANPSENFAAVMTCSHADQNCPVVFGCEKRIPLTYDDPKEYDDTALETGMYDYRSFQIATELFYVFSLIK